MDVAAHWPPEARQHGQATVGDKVLGDAVCSEGRENMPHTYTNGTNETCWKQIAERVRMCIPAMENAAPRNIKHRSMD